MVWWWRLFYPSFRLINWTVAEITGRVLTSSVPAACARGCGRRTDGVMPTRHSLVHTPTHAQYSQTQGVIRLPWSPGTCCRACQRVGVAIFYPRLSSLDTARSSVSDRKTLRWQTQMLCLWYQVAKWGLQMSSASGYTCHDCSADLFTYSHLSAQSELSQV